MPISKAAIYTLAVLTTLKLSDEADATPSPTLSQQEPEASNVVADNNINALNPTKSENASFQTPIGMAPPETLEAQPLAGVNVGMQSHPISLEQTDAVNVSTLATNIFTPYLDRIKRSLPPRLMMRLPSQLGDHENLDGKDVRYIVAVSPSTSEPGLTLNLFTCEAQLQSCWVGSFVMAAKTSVAAQREFENYRTRASSITLANNIQGYLLEGSKQKMMAEFSSVMWEQDEQFYIVRLPAQSRLNLLNIVDSMTRAIPIQSMGVVPEAPANNPVSVNDAQKPQEETEDLITTASTAALLQNRHPVLTTAEQLQQGEVVTSLRYRQSFPSGTARDVGLTGQPTFGISWGVTDKLELTLDAQTVDNSGPGNQGPFKALRINPDNTGPNLFQEFTFQAKQRLWQNEEGTQALSGVVAASLGNAGRPYRFFDETGAISNGKNNEIVTSLELPFTIRTDNRLQLTLSPKVAFLPNDNALYFNTPPVEKPGSFGTTFGLAGGISYQLNPRLILWGDAFVPLTGNNTINRDTGLPARTIAFNAGLRYIVNPRLATDLFVSNTLGNTGPLSIVTDSDNPSLGLGITYLPGITSANRRYSQHFHATQQPPPDTVAGFGLLDGGTIANQQLRLSLQGGEQGLLTGIRYGLLDDLEIGAFLESIPGTVDESALGLSGKVRFLHQADGDPFTLSGLVTVARSNNVLVNLINDNRNELEERGLEKSGFAFSNEKAGELLIITLSTPMHYQFKGGSAIWLTPTLGFVQRNGLEIAGLNLGGSVPLARGLDAIAEAGLELSGNGNAFVGNNRETVIPWTVGLRWHPASLLGIPKTSAISGLQLEAYVTNRVGTTPFGSLRVRADNDTAIGVGLVLPIQF
jgi:hypothetical protein